MKMKVEIFTVVALLGLSDRNVVASAREVHRFKRPPLVPAIFVFGDSTVDVGTNTYLEHPAFLANFTPYGETYFQRPTGRFCDGRLWVDFVTQKLGLPFPEAYLAPKTKDYTRGVNFASAGSGYSASVRPGTVVNLPEQYQQFLKVKDVLVNTKRKIETKFILNHALYVVSTGSNDIFTYIGNVTALSTISSEAFLTNLFSQVQLILQALYRAGARKIILGALSTLGCIPAVRITTEDGSCSAFVNSLAQSFNERLATLTDRLKTTTPDLFVIIVNNYHLLDQFINNGASYGFTQGSNACCGGGPLNAVVQCGTLDANGNKNYTLCSHLQDYVFWDQFHPTEKTYGLLADAWMDGDEKCAYPFNIRRLIDC